MRRTVLGGLAATLLLTLTACGGDDDTAGDDAATPSSTSASDDVAGIVTGTPTDVRWRPPVVPASWKRLKVGGGEAQWQVSDTCVVTLFQPAGLGKATEPTQEQVLDTYARRSGQAIGAVLDISSRDTSMFTLVTSSAEIAAKTKVSHARLTDGKGAEGEIYAYRRGDFALVLITMCGQDDFATVDASDFQPFIGKLAIIAEY